MEELIEQRYQILQRTSQQRERIGGRRMPRISEPVRECTHWDYYLEEMKWLASDFIEDRKHKQALAYVIVNEIRTKKLQAEKKEIKKESKLKDQAKKLSDMVCTYFFQIDDGKRFFPTEAEVREKIWSVSEVITNPPALNIVLINSRSKKNTKINTSQSIHKYTLSIIHHFGYTNPSACEDLNKEPSTPETNLHENETDTTEANTNFQLFYDVENFEKDLNLQLEDLHLEDIDIYRPLASDHIEFRDITYEEALFEEELFELVPDSEEYMICENTKKCIEVREELPMSIDINTNCKRDWKIFEDMALEQSVCEFGGNWEFISDLLSINQMCTFNYITPEECFNRWALLQKRKGRVLSGVFRPAQVFQNEFPPVQYINSKFSVNRQNNNQCFVVPRHVTMASQEGNEKAFEFYLKNCVRPEANQYFSNYKAINSKFYNEISQPKISVSERNMNNSQKNPVQAFIDKEEENTASILTLIDAYKLEEANKEVASGKSKPPVNGAPAIKKK